MGEILTFSVLMLPETFNLVIQKKSIIALAETFFFLNNEKSKEQWFAYELFPEVLLPIQLE